MNLLMISGDRSILEGRQGAFHSMLQEFALHWERIDIICPRPAFLAAQRVSLPQNVFFHPSPHGLWFQPFWIMKEGKRLFRSLPFHVMAVHEYPPFYNGVGAWLLSRAVHVPYALEIHHIVGYPFVASFTELLGRVLSRLFLPIDAIGARTIRTVNGIVRDQLASWRIPAAKLSVVSSFYLDSSLAALFDGQTKQYDIACCGRLVPNKGFSAVIDALGQLPNATLVFIGDGPDRNRLERRARARGVQDRITFAGWLPDQQSVLRTMSSARVFLMNSRSEGGPRVLLEAMAIGMPVLTTQVGIVSDVVQDGVNGLLTTGQPHDLVQQLSHLLSDADLRARLGKAARDVLGRFEKKHLIKAYADFLQRIA
ncbi:MAG: glycosyltransferase family 4 protein [Candidatus Peribacteraceae bacterium]|nr:glycosyltransferase family 4 protein [Candidatus Peribacteraceae bacterium]